MPAGKKWVYWHRVIWADNDCEEGAVLKTGSLLGLCNKDTSCARLVHKESTKSFDLVDYVKLQYVGRLLKTATPEEVVAAFGPAILDAATLKALPTIRDFPPMHDAAALKAHQEHHDNTGVRQ